MFNVKMVMALALLFVAVASYAQPPGGGRPGMDSKESATRQTEELTKSLKLTDVQKDSVYSYLLAQGEGQQKLFQSNQGGDRSAMMGKMQELRSKTDDKINAVLDDTQKKAYEKIVKERANRRGPR